MKATGKVIKTYGGRASVESMRKSSCSSCKDCEAKGACHAELIFGNQTQNVIIEADNKIGAKIGETVELESSTGKTLGVSAVIFVIPIIISVLVYIYSTEFLTDAQSAVALLLSLIVSFFVLIKLMNRFVKSNLTTHIVRILEESEE